MEMGMRDRFDPADFSKIRTHSLQQRANKIAVEAFASVCDEQASLTEFLDGLPDVLAVRTLRNIASAVALAKRKGRLVVWAMGAHPIKVGLSPVLIDLMERGVIKALVLNGAGAIHDWEIAALGATSEDVAAGLDDGSFGMVDETGRELSAAAREAADASQGLGEVVGRRIARSDLPHRGLSLLATAHRLGIPATVHVAIGGDIVHMHPAADGGAIGAATFTDFRKLATVVSGLGEGVWIHCGSAVQIPEVFLKALTVARNLGQKVAPITMANLDMMRHYRVEQNVLQRPTRLGGAAYNLIGHHEINVPLLAATIRREIDRRSSD
jgi:deoxyhypusine synthase